MLRKKEGSIFQAFLDSRLRRSDRKKVFQKSHFKKYLLSLERAGL
jgi:hypothetical protein